MNRGFVCFLVLGLASALVGADFDNVGSETKTISAKISTPANLDKSKRGAVKLSNAENPAFNHLAPSNPNGAANFKQPQGVNSNPPPFRYLYTNQLYHQPNPYLTYVQLPQAAQIAAQYAFQSNPVTHYLQTPTQIQYVSTPTVAQVPQIKYQSYSNEYSSSSSDAGSSSAAASSHYSTAPQQPQSSTSHTYSSSASQPSTLHTYSSSASQPSTSHTYSSSSPQPSASSASQAKQVQVPLYSGYQTAQQVYYPQQQPYFTFVPQPHISPANFIYQQPNANYYLKQQQYLNLYGGNRFGLYTPSSQTGQLTYLVPMSVTPAVQEQTTTTSDLKSSDKTLASTQHASSSNVYPYVTKV